MLFRKMYILELQLLKCGTQTGRGRKGTRLGPGRPVRGLLWGSRKTTRLGGKPTWSTENHQPPGSVFE